MKTRILSIFLGCVVAFDIHAQGPLNIVNRASSQNLCLQVSPSGTATNALCINGSTKAATFSGGIATTSFVAPTIQKFTTGSGTYTTPTSPRSPLFIRVRMVGGGGGGGGVGSGASAGGNGGNTTFGTTLLVANGGTGGQNSGASQGGGAGGSINLNGATGSAFAGGSGTGAGFISGTAINQGGCGASSPFGGAGGGGSQNGGGFAAATNSGSGGGGGASNSVSGGAGGGGGGAGGYVDAYIGSPSATYAYAIGSAGTVGAAGTGGSAGGLGGAGYIEVTEYYQ